jgi:hypothetical protein
MNAAYLSPYRSEDQARARGCLACSHFLGRFYAEHLRCERDGARKVMGVPAIGCAFWQREPRGRQWVICLADRSWQSLQLREVFDPGRLFRRLDHPCRTLCDLTA